MTVDPHVILLEDSSFPTSPRLYTSIALSLLTIQIQADLRPQFIQGPVFIKRLYQLV